jgi:hypothetical protein
MPLLARHMLEEIPAGFVDDGCSNSRDSMFGFDFRWACRLHDHAYCTRCWPAGSMTQMHRRVADANLAMMIRSALPWRWRWVGWWYRRGVHYGGGVSAYDSCGATSGAICRHGMPIPDWMAEQIG